MNISEALNRASELAKKSTCMRRKYGAVITNKNGRNIAEGFNSAACGETPCTELGYCEREKLNIPKGQRYELCRGVHAEQKALIHAQGNELYGATIYIVGYEMDGTFADGHPCLICERMIKESGIQKVVYMTKEGTIKIKDRDQLCKS